MTDCDVLIVGAGPTGLVLALWLAKQRVRVRIIDKTAEPGTTSRALAVQARTLELYRQLDLADETLAKGHKVPAINLWVRGKAAARIPFQSFAGDITPYQPFIFPQDEHERLLIARLEQLGVSVERKTELLAYTLQPEGVSAKLRGPDGSEENCQATYLAGCDGASSLVREAMGTGFPGGTYQQVFYVADIDGSGPSLNGELHVDLDEADFLAVFPMKGEGRARLIGTVRDERAKKADSLKFEDVSDRAIRNMKVVVNRVNWFSTYRVHHRVARQFRKGPVFLLGDAAHIHSPAGGQGMNTGIGDAINLAWKLKAVLSGRADEALLDTYETERIAFARKLVATTDRAFTFATGEGLLADLLRTRLAPVVIPAVVSMAPVRHYIYSAVSQVTVNYRGSAVSEGRAGTIRGGDRLPWLPAAGNFVPLNFIGWQAHVYGVASNALSAWCREHAIPLHCFPWHEGYSEKGFSRGALYLLRPDTYVALASADATPEVLERYFADKGIVPQNEAG